MKSIIVCGIKELINDADEQFLLCRVVTNAKTHLGAMGSHCRGHTNGPFVLNLHCTKTVSFKGGNESSLSARMEREAMVNLRDKFHSCDCRNKEWDQCVKDGTRMESSGEIFCTRFAFLSSD